jgi:hypothetical protein
VWRRPACPKIPTQVPTVAAHVLALAGSAVLLQVLLSSRFAAVVVVVMVMGAMAAVAVASVVSVFSLSATTCACSSTRSRPAIT